MEGQQEMTRAVSNSLKEAVQGLSEASSKKGGTASDAQDAERVSPLTGLEFKQPLPILKDSNTEFDEHWEHETDGCIHADTSMLDHHCTVTFE